MKLRTYRERLKIPFLAAAQELDCSPSQLSRIETGKCIPQPDLMSRIRKWSGGMVQPNDFYDDEGLA